MYSLSSAVWAWLTDSANILLDLAIAGRDAKNPVVLAIVATLAVIRIAAFLIFTFPALGWIKNQIWLTTERKRKDEWVKETSVRAFVIILIIASIAFEVWVSPERKSADEARTGTEAAYDYDGM